MARILNRHRSLLCQSRGASPPFGRGAISHFARQHVAGRQAAGTADRRAHGCGGGDPGRGQQETALEAREAVCMIAALPPARWALYDDVALRVEALEPAAPRTGPRGGDEKKTGT